MTSYLVVTLASSFQMFHLLGIHKSVTCGFDFQHLNLSRLKVVTKAPNVLAQSSCS